jgi:D-lactate dehydrogenase
MALLSPDIRRIGRPGGPAAPDRAPDSLAAGTPEPLRGDLIRLLGADRVLPRAIDLIRYASDASPYRVFPATVIMARDVEDVAKVLGYARQTGIPVNFRGGGTSLNGQAQTEGIMVDVRRWWSSVDVLDGGARVRLGCGTVLGFANRILARHGYKLGPDPGSTQIATVGGVIANNSGGMKCGTTWDPYATVESMTLVLASGAVIDTAAPDAEEQFARAQPELARCLLELREELRSDAELTERVRRKYQIKNVTGYRLCALLDADTPLEIFRRLVIGSEGTLAFVAEVVMRTRPEPPRTTISWVHFPSIDAATGPVPALVRAGARAVELMVAPALIAAAWNMPGTPEYWKELPPGSAALLVEFGGSDDAELDDHVRRAEEILAGQGTLRKPAFTRDAGQIELAWTVREGLFGLVGRLRPAGTALIVEDVCVPPERIAECASDLQGLLGKHGFLVGVAGHASAGNLHFQLTPDFSKAEDLARYEAFMGEMVELIVGRYDGSLKAEHGTGLNMAPYVEREWGEKATRMMWRVKQLADPLGILNPGVVLNRDPDVHLRHLKTQPAIEDAAAPCVECGFCEPVCPSRNTTTTPRQRIVIRREMARQPEGSPVYEALLADYDYEAIQTCAADGTCQLACPIAIDTGKVMKEFRHRERSDREERIALALARRYGMVERLARQGLRAAAVAERVLGHRAVAAGPAALRQRVSRDLVPSLPRSLPPAAPARLPTTGQTGAVAVYIPACINRIFGNPAGLPRSPTLPEALCLLSDRAGRPLWIPSDVPGTCCATPWSSKGYRWGQGQMARATAEQILRWTGQGELPVVIDASSCAHGLIQDVGPELPEPLLERYRQVRILDSIDWVHDQLLPHLTISDRAGSAAVHPTCSVLHMGLEEKLLKIGQAMADEVIVPAGTTCCGMAGDRGLLHPELPRSALREVRSELEEAPPDVCLCSNRTCELALQEVTGRPYRSFVLELERRSRP